MKAIVLILAYLSLTTIAYAENQIYAVQVLMAKEYSNAVNEYEKLKDAYHDVRIEQIKDAYTVRIGTYRTKTNALSSLKQLKMMQKDAFLIKYDIDKQEVIKGNHRADQVKTNKPPTLPSTKIVANNTIAPPPTGMPTLTIRKGIEPPNTQEALKPIVIVSKKIPETEKNPIEVKAKEDLLTAGTKSYHAGKYESTIGLLSKYASLAPKSQHRGAALLIIGKSLEQMKKPKSALDIYGRILEQYPDSPVSLFSIVAIADISVTNPGLHYPIGKKGADYLSDPVFAYDTVLSKNVPTPMIEHIQYQKGLALWKLKRYEQAQQSQTEFLKKFPNSAYRRDVVTMLRDGINYSINQYSKSGDHISVANLFIQGWKHGLITTEDVDTLQISSYSLSHLGLYDDSLKILTSLKKDSIGKTSAEIDKVIAETEKRKDISLTDQLPSDVKWIKFQAGREYLHANNLRNAEQTFSDLKKNDTDPFWSKITEYALEEKKWIEKYKDIVDKKLD